MKIETVWSEYRTSLKAFLHKNVSNPDDVDDLLQEILIKTYNNLGKIKDKNKIKPWLFQIANNTIIDFYRKSGKTTEEINDDVWETEPEEIVQELSTCVVPFIKALPDEHADLLTEIEIKGVSQKEYAQSKGIKYSTLKSRVQKSRTLLHKLFNDCCDFSIDSQGNLLDYEKKTSQCGKC
ncbi:RNA polymerase sigma factor SigZ [Vibrio sp. ZSDE26]|uniref:RNA polymerase sigma factor SigZ n=1 Tax=Vibrio amylolyticus TaxID=2847292 RepID=A0A9X1XI48_9VIBR|nr:RNA polymerase sigma factor SigZ [Vibrio amylolyticus]MCK6263384.1 RNA polymerase sigma factor SigZ [Vibrio amylolyticus]